MILEFDIGNTRAKWRVISACGSQVVVRGDIPTPDLGAFSVDVLPAGISLVRLASVASEVLVHGLIKCLQARLSVPIHQAKTQGISAGVINSYDDPSKMGVDRWLTIVAAYHRAQGACCVVDCGTAIKIEFISAQGRHRGGYILPSAKMMVSSLLRNTAQIANGMTHQIDYQGLGTSTAGAVHGGAEYLTRALRKQILVDVKREGGCPLYVTGGDAKVLFPSGEGVTYCPDLVFEGLAIVLS
ncbi:MAG: type III pantothenate kinase [Pontibacterium sp.]